MFNVVKVAPSAYKWFVKSVSGIDLCEGVATSKNDAIERARRFMKRNQNAVFDY